MLIDVVPVGEWGIFEPGSPLFIAGPCSAESRAQVLGAAAGVSAASVTVFRAGLWKPRTHSGCFEGVGEKGIRWMQEAKEKYGLRICTEVLSGEHAGICLDAGFDLLWIGARTTGNPFAVREIAGALKGSDIPVLVKNPMAEDIGLWCGALERLHNAGLGKLGAVLRGFPSFMKSAYRNEPHWEAVESLRKMMPGIPVFCDPSHISGDAALVPSIARRAMDMGMDGVMVESHPRPGEALSDAAQQLNPVELKALTDELRNRKMSENQFDATVSELRAGIDSLDETIVRDLAARMDICRRIARIKMEHNAPVVQPDRWNKVLEEVGGHASRLGLDPEYVRSVFNTIHDTSIKEQNKIIAEYAENQDKG